MTSLRTIQRKMGKIPEKESESELLFEATFQLVKSQPFEKQESFLSNLKIKKKLRKSIWGLVIISRVADRIYETERDFSKRFDLIKLENPKIQDDLVHYFEFLHKTVGSANGTGPRLVS